MTSNTRHENSIAQPKQMSILHLICYRSTVVQVLFCSLKKGNYPEMCMLCFALINTILVNLLMRLDLNEQHIDFNCKCAFGDKFGVLCCLICGVCFLLRRWRTVCDASCCGVAAGSERWH